MLSRCSRHMASSLTGSLVLFFALAAAMTSGSWYSGIFTKSYAPLFCGCIDATSSQFARGDNLSMPCSGVVELSPTDRALYGGYGSHWHEDQISSTKVTFRDLAPVLRMSPMDLWEYANEVLSLVFDGGGEILDRPRRDVCLFDGPSSGGMDRRL